MRWMDVTDIVEALRDERPEIDDRDKILAVRFTDLHRWVTELEDFEDDPQKSNEKILEAIQMAWLDEIED